MFTAVMKLIEVVLHHHIMNSSKGFFTLTPSLLSGHYPVFHQMEGVRLWSAAELSILTGPHTLQSGSAKSIAPAKCADVIVVSCDSVNTQLAAVSYQAVHPPLAAAYVEENLKATLSGLATHLFGANIEVRWVPAFFPFTCPSWELEIMFNGKWMEVL